MNSVEQDYLVTDHMLSMIMALPRSQFTLNPWQVHNHSMTLLHEKFEDALGIIIRICRGPGQSKFERIILMDTLSSMGCRLMIMKPFT